MATITAEIVADLSSPDAYPHSCETIRCVETHISWVFLTGPYAYKVKKPVDFGFLNFSTLEKRHHYCVEEVRCNRRFARDLYLDVVTIRRAEDGRLSLLGEGEVVDYAVRMRQFAPEAELDHRLASGALTAAEMATFGRELGRIHGSLPQAAADTGWGTPEAVHAPVLENFAQIAATRFQQVYADRLARLATWAEHQREGLNESFVGRRAQGFVRECHGDLHLSNMVMLDGHITAFDCIEFSPGLRWIDVMSDAAFLLMDCLVRERADLGYGFLDAYMAGGGDYAGGRLLGYYIVYRSMVRAKVAALQADAADADERFLRHLAFAEQRAFSARPLLVLTCGLSGSGKSWLAERLVGELGAVRVRSDVERKRLHGLDASARSKSAVDQGLYSLEATAAVYEHLAQCARAMLQGGESVIVDATFLDPALRQKFLALSHSVGVPAAVLYCTAPDEVLEGRVAARAQSGIDPSEADVSVLRRQRERFVPPSANTAVIVDTSRPVDVPAVIVQIRRSAGLS